MSSRGAAVLLTCLLTVTLPLAGLAGEATHVVTGSAPLMVSASGLAPSGGRFLVAARGMRDPRFSETVILLVVHDENGTMGLVINRPTKVPLSKALPQISWPDDPPRYLFLGGPVIPQGVSFLLRSRETPEPALRILDGVFHSGSPALLAETAAGKAPGTEFRVFAGHAGWAPGQLDGELKRGDWRVLEAQAEDVFHEPPSEIWQELVQRAEGEWVRLHGCGPATTCSRPGGSATVLARRIR
ncbi:MAG: YqgE/AlgH family protein [Deltaproteobacteria bacterium]|nr:YqgE/AlgH family protein [Deltaproteobacteria bacterium]